MLLDDALFDALLNERAMYVIGDRGLRLRSDQGRHPTEIP
jgi:hypothetical protein